MEQITFLLTHLYVLYGIPMRLIKGQKIMFMPGFEYQHVDPLVIDSKIIKTLICKPKNSPFLEIENNNILYGVCKSVNETSCIIGPVSLYPLTGNELYKYKSIHGLLSYTDFKIHNGSIEKTASALSLIHQEMNNEVIDLSQIIEQFVSKIDNVKVTEKDILNYDFINTEQGREHHPYNVEKAYMTAMANGDLDAIKKLNKADISEHLGIMANTSLKQAEYLAVASITLFCRAAIEGGADSDKVYKISDLYLQKVSMIRNELEFQKVLISITEDLCERVRHAKKQKSANRYIEQSKNFVAKNIYKQFTLTDIADAIKINKCYLSNQFMRHEGKSLKRYIQDERIKVAQNMLKYSDKPISFIANYLCFNSQSHFGSVFKRIVGITPAYYRKNNK